MYLPYIDWKLSGIVRRSSESVVDGFRDLLRIINNCCYDPVDDDLVRPTVMGGIMVDMGNDIYNPDT